MSTQADNCLIGFPNYADVSPASPNGFWPGLVPVISGGLWQASAPLSNLQNRLLSYKTRSLSLTADSTQFQVDLGQLRYIGAVVIPSHNMTSLATYTMSFFQDAALTVQVGATLSGTVFPAGPTTTTPTLTNTDIITGYYNTIFGRVPDTAGLAYWLNQVETNAQTLAQVQESFLGSSGATSFLATYPYPSPFLVIPNLLDPIVARYIVVTLSDVANPNGYIELSRLIVAPGYQASLNVKYGSTIGAVDPTIRTASAQDVDFFDKRTRRREAIVSWDFLPQAEALSFALDYQMRQGLSKQCFFSMFPTDATNFSRCSFLAVMEKVDPLVGATYNTNSITFSLKEVVG